MVGIPVDEVLWKTKVQFSNTLRLLESQYTLSCEI